VDTELKGGPLPLPEPWRIARLIGWVGGFEVCSDRCESDIQRRTERPEPSTNPPAPLDSDEADISDLEDTDPQIPSKMPKKPD